MRGGKVENILQIIGGKKLLLFVIILMLNIPRISDKFNKFVNQKKNTAELILITFRVCAFASGGFNLQLVPVGGVTVVFFLY